MVLTLSLFFFRWGELCKATWFRKGTSGLEVGEYVPCCWEKRRERKKRREREKKAPEVPADAPVQDGGPETDCNPPTCRITCKTAIVQFVFFGVLQSPKSVQIIGHVSPQAQGFLAGMSENLRVGYNPWAL
jgi:hypothetical protein